MKKNIGSHISSRLRNLSKAELDAAAKQVLIIFERAVVARFISRREVVFGIKQIISNEDVCFRNR